MIRRITETFRGFDQSIIVVTLPDDHKHSASTTAFLRAWAVDDENDEEWWANVLEDGEVAA